MLGMSAGIHDIKLIIPITEIRSVYVVDTDSITDNIFVCNIFLCCKGGRTNIHQLLRGRNKYSYPERTNIGEYLFLGEQIFFNTRHTL